MEHIGDSTKAVPASDLTSLASVPSSPSTFTPSVPTSTATSTDLPFCCGNFSEIYSQPHLNTTNGTQYMEAAIEDDQGKFHMMKDGFDDYFDEEYPTLILILSFGIGILVMMMVIGIALYPAVKKYCDSTFPNMNNDDEGGNSYWIEDTEKVSSASALTTSLININDSSVALLNSSSGADANSSCANFNVACDIELLSET